MADRNIDFSIDTIREPADGRSLPLPDSQASPGRMSGIRQFNLKMMDILKQYQGVTTADLMKRKNTLLKAKYGRIDEITPEELRTLNPAQQQAIRDAKTAALTPDIDKLNVDIGTRQQMSSNFASVFNQVRQIGTEIAKLEQPEIKVVGKSLLSVSPDGKVEILHNEGNKPEYKVINDSLVRINPDNTVDIVQVPKDPREEKMNITFKDDGQGNIYKLVTDPFSGETIRMEKLEGIGKAPSTDATAIGTELGLTPEQITAGNKLAKDLYGSSAIRTADGYRNFAMPILQRMAAGENIDTIADDLRYRGQSPAFTGTIRLAAQQITSKLSDRATQEIFDKLDDVIDTGDIVKTKDFLKKMAVDNAAGGAVQAKEIMGKERTVEFIDEIYDDLKAYEDAGGDTNLFTGTVEDLLGKAGVVGDPKLRELYVKIARARMEYRRQMTGVSFNKEENKEYYDIFPAINKTSEFNTAAINGLFDSFNGDVDFFYRFAMGSDAYDEIFKGEKKSVQPSLDDAFEGFDFDIDISQFDPEDA